VWGYDRSHIYTHFVHSLAPIFVTFDAAWYAFVYDVQILGQEQVSRETRRYHVSYKGAKSFLYQLEDQSSDAVEEEEHAGYFREAQKNASAESLEGWRIRHQDSKIVVPCATHVRDFWVRVRYVYTIWV